MNAETALGGKVEVASEIVAVVVRRNAAVARFIGAAGTIAVPAVQAMEPGIASALLPVTGMRRADGSRGRRARVP